MQYLTPEEVADRLRVSKWSVYRMVDRGELPSARIGRLVRIPEEALPDLVKRRQKVGDPDAQ